MNNFYLERKKKAHDFVATRINETYRAMLKEAIIKLATKLQKETKIVTQAELTKEMVILEQLATGNFVVIK